MRSSVRPSRPLITSLAVALALPILLGSGVARADGPPSPPPESVGVRARMEGGEPGEDLITAGEVGRGLTICGGILTGVGSLTMLVGAAPGERNRTNQDEARLYVGAGMAVTGVVLLGVGVPLWATGEKDGRSAALRVGPGSVELSGTF